MGAVQFEVRVLLHALTVDVQPLDGPCVVAGAQLKLRMIQCACELVHAAQHSEAGLVSGPTTHQCSKVGAFSDGG